MQPKSHYSNPVSSSSIKVFAPLNQVVVNSFAVVAPRDIADGLLRIFSTIKRLLTIGLTLF